MYNNELGFSKIRVKIPRREYVEQPLQKFDIFGTLFAQKYIVETDEDGKKWMPEKLDTYYVQNGAFGHPETYKQLMSSLRTSGDIELICSSKYQ